MLLTGDAFFRVQRWCFKLCSTFLSAHASSNKENVPISLLRLSLMLGLLPYTHVTYTCTQCEFLLCSLFFLTNQKSYNFRTHCADRNPKQLIWTMIKLIFIQFVLMATYSCTTIPPEDCVTFNNHTYCYCFTPYVNFGLEVCGTDDRTYHSAPNLVCERRKEYGRRINLQIKHEGPCNKFIFYLQRTSTFNLVNTLSIDIILISICQYDISQYFFF